MYSHKQTNRKYYGYTYPGKLCTTIVHVHYAIFSERKKNYDNMLGLVLVLRAAHILAIYFTCGIHFL